MIQDMFGNIGQQQEELKRKLDEIILSHHSDDNLIHIEISASKKLLDITFDEVKFQGIEKEELEDRLMITLNEAFEKADAAAGEKTQELLNEMLPPGFGNMLGL
jgi:DNA-binding protein YbaB